MTLKLIVFTMASYGKSFGDVNEALSTTGRLLELALRQDFVEFQLLPPRAWDDGHDIWNDFARNGIDSDVGSGSSAGTSFGSSTPMSSGTIVYYLTVTILRE